MCEMNLICEIIVQTKSLEDVYLTLKHILFFLFAMSMHVEDILDPKEWLEKY